MLFSVLSTVLTAADRLAASLWLGSAATLTLELKRDYGRCRSRLLTGLVCWLKVVLPSWLPCLRLPWVVRKCR